MRKFVLFSFLGVATSFGFCLTADAGCGARGQRAGLLQRHHERVASRHQARADHHATMASRRGACASCDATQAAPATPARTPASEPIQAPTKK